MGATEHLRRMDKALEDKTRTLVRQYSQTTEDSEREELKSQLAETVENHFKVRQEIREREISELEKKAENPSRTTKRTISSQKVMSKSDLSGVVGQRASDEHCPVEGAASGTSCLGCRV